MKVLACDIGGTKTLLQIAEVSSLDINTVVEHRYPSQEYACFDDILKEFLSGPAESYKTEIHAACLGVAGPVNGDKVIVTNLPWVVSSKEIKETLQCNRVKLINDFQAVGYGIEGLTDDDLVCLQQGEPALHANRAIIGAGTGLGEGLLVWSDDHYEAHASEGGHIDFAPVDDLQIRMLHYWHQKIGMVPYNVFLSGPGIVNIFEFLQQDPSQDLGLHASRGLLDAMADGDASEVISRFALDQKDDLASKAMEVFVKIYGAQAGNLALTTLPSGGVYIAGGIAAKIVDLLKDDVFLEAFHDKAKMQHLMSTFPVYVVMNQKVGLIGAALVASRL